MWPSHIWPRKKHKTIPLLKVLITAATLLLFLCVWGARREKNIKIDKTDAVGNVHKVDNIDNIDNFDRVDNIGNADTWIIDPLLNMDTRDASASKTTWKNG